jgi:hypothetical protein
MQAVVWIALKRNTTSINQGQAKTACLFFVENFRTGAYQYDRNGFQRFPYTDQEC